MNFFTCKMIQRLSVSAAVVLALSSSVANGHDHYRSVASKVLSNYAFKITDRSAKARVTTANAFIKTLDDGLKKKLLFPIDSEERVSWTNLPTPKDEKGLRFSDLNSEQVEAGLKMLATMLSKEGYDTAVHIPLADDELIPVGEKATKQQGYGVDNFILILFANPSVDETWALQYDGHHLAYNLTFQGEKVTMSPSFIGTRPSKFELNGEEIKPINGLSNKALKLINLLEGDQLKQAVIAKKHFDLRTGAGKDGVVPAPRGVQVRTFSDSQKKALMMLMGEYTAVMPAEVAKLRNAELEKELDQMYFAWGGSTEAGKPISYAIQGPSAIIEYTCRGGGKQALDHIHAIYRNPKNEYGVRFVK